MAQSCGLNRCLITGISSFRTLVGYLSIAKESQIVPPSILIRSAPPNPCGSTSSIYQYSM